MNGISILLRKFETHLIWVPSVIFRANRFVMMAFTLFMSMFMLLPASSSAEVATLVRMNVLRVALSTAAFADPDSLEIYSTLSFLAK